MRLMVHQKFYIDNGCLLRTTGVTGTQSDRDDVFATNQNRVISICMTQNMKDLYRREKYHAGWATGTEFRFAYCICETILTMQNYSVPCDRHLLRWSSQRTEVA